MKKILVCVIALLPAFVNGQSVGEIFKISNVNYSSSTARSSAMGGAFGSLGADAASMSINPAGLGMYKKSDVSLSPSLNFSSISSRAEGLNGQSINTKQNHGALAVNNGTFIYNIYSDRNQPIRALTIGFGYNQRYNNVSKQYSRSNFSETSIADYFASQLYGLSNSNITSTNSDYYQPYNITSVSVWDAVAAWNSGLLFSDRDGFGNTAYYTNGFDDSGNPIGSLFPGDRVTPSLSTRNKGYNGEYNFSLGANVNDVFFFGATMGVANFDFRTRTQYRETTPNGNRGDLAELRLYQEAKTYGVAFNFKVGVTIQPLQGLKIGAAIHAPSVYNIDDNYSSAINNYFYVGSGTESYDANTALYVNSFKVKTPARFIGGISYTFGQWAILSFDYERVWYNKMQVKGIDYAPGEYTFDDEITDTYRATNNFRGGIEINTGLFLLRGGYAYYGNPLKEMSDNLGKVTNITAGIGFRHRNAYFDLAYIYAKENLSPFKYYSATYGNETIQSESTIYSVRKNNNIIATIGFRF